MIFKVSNKRKIGFSIIFSIIGTIILRMQFPNMKNFTISMFITIFAIVLLGVSKNKDTYLIENNILIINENTNKICIRIKEISFIVCKTFFSGAGYHNGIGVKEIYSIKTKDLKYEIDETMTNLNHNSLIDVLQH